MGVGRSVYGRTPQAQPLRAVLQGRCEWGAEQAKRPGVRILDRIEADTAADEDSLTPSFGSSEGGAISPPLANP